MRQLSWEGALMKIKFVEFSQTEVDAPRLRQGNNNIRWREQQR